MSNPKTQSETQRPAPLTPEQRFQAEKNLAHLIVAAQEKGISAALEEWRRFAEAKQGAKAPNSPEAVVR